MREWSNYVHFMYSCFILPFFFGGGWYFSNHTDSTLIKRCAVLYCHLLIHAYIYIYMLDSYRLNDKDAGRLLYKNIYLSLYCKGSERVTQGLRMTGSWRPNRNCDILTPTLMAVDIVSFSFSWGSTGGPEAHSAGWWLSLLHLISIFSGPQLIRALRPLRPDVAFPTTTRL